MYLHLKLRKLEIRNQAYQIFLVKNSTLQYTQTKNYEFLICKTLDRISRVFFICENHIYVPKYVINKLLMWC